MTTRQLGKEAHLLQQVVAEVGHELGGGVVDDLLVAERLEGLLQRLMKQAAVGKALGHILHVLVVQLNDLAHEVLLPSASCKQQHLRPE